MYRPKLTNTKLFQKRGDIRRKSVATEIERRISRGIKPRMAVATVSLENGLSDAEHAKFMERFDIPRSKESWSL